MIFDIQALFEVQILSDTRVLLDIWVNFFIEKLNETWLFDFLQNSTIKPDDSLSYDRGSCEWCSIESIGIGKSIARQGYVNLTKIFQETMVRRCCMRITSALYWVQGNHYLRTPLKYRWIQNSREDRN